MPEISRFLGIVISMYFNDRNPPHFHVRYGERRATVSIHTLEVTAGDLPARVLGLVSEWATIRRAELLENWTQMASSGTFKSIEPLV
jgi:hypothetical protein